MLKSVEHFLSRRVLMAMTPAALLPAAAHAEEFRSAPLPPGELRIVRLAVGGVADITHLAVW